MTNEEAIDCNNNLKEYMKITDKTSEYKFLQENYEALDIANKALEQQPSDDCISRAQALHACCDEWNKDYKAIMKSIRQLPSVTPQQKIGKWIADYRIWKCSNCDASFDTWRHEIVYNKYCPNCGAKMEEVEEV